MRAKKAKAARRLARKISSGWPDRVFVQSGNPKQKPVPWPDGRCMIRPAGVLRAHSKCTRGVYKQIKAWLRVGETLEGIERKISHVAA